MYVCACVHDVSIHFVMNIKVDLLLTETNSIRQEVDFNFINNFHYHYMWGDEWRVDNSCHGNNNPYQLGKH